MDQIAIENISTKVKRICFRCGSKETKHRDENKNWLCNKCYAKFIGNPKVLSFKGKRISVKNTYRIGVCNFCRAVLGEIDAQRNVMCGKVDRHHFSDDEEHPVKYRLDLCLRCHHGYERTIMMNKQLIRYEAKEKEALAKRLDILYETFAPIFSI